MTETGGRRTTSAFRGCLLGGAVGDALGASVEFLSLEEIRMRFGVDGIIEPAPAYGRVGAITDDTQMTMFTAEGVLRAHARGTSRGICHPPSVLHHAYVRWLYSQRFTSEARWRPPFDGWLFSIGDLHQRRAPGRTCVTALQQPMPGSFEKPINQSKGCGGVMRVAPIGLLGSDPFRLACEAAAITHGHPTGYLAAGAFGLIIHRVVNGDAVSDAVECSMRELEEWHYAGEVLAALRCALDAADRDAPSAATVESIGQGWVAEQALAIAVYAALCFPKDLVAALRLAVNHSGDSDSTGAIAGNILGAALGAEAIPARWLETLELRDEVTSLADDLLTGFRDDAQWSERYPGW